MQVSGWRAWFPAGMNGNAGVRDAGPFLTRRGGVVAVPLSQMEKAAKGWLWRLGKGDGKGGGRLRVIIVRR
jgi:hypothetical protein